MLKTIPSQAQKYFWGDDLNQLNWDDHKNYIIQTLLNKGDYSSLTWLLQQVGRADILNLLPTLKLDPKSRNFWSIYLS